MKTCQRCGKEYEARCHNSFYCDICYVIVHTPQVKECGLCGRVIDNAHGNRDYHESCRIALNNLRCKLRTRYKNKKIPDKAQYQVVQIYNIVNWLVSWPRVGDLKEAYADHHQDIEDLLLNIDRTFSKLEQAGWKPYSVDSP